MEELKENLTQQVIEQPASCTKEKAAYRLKVRVCRRYSRAYLRHLFKAEEMLAMRLAVMHNLYFYNQLTARIREALDAGTFAEFRSRYSERLAQRAED